MTSLTLRNASRARRSIFVVMTLAALGFGCGTEAPAGGAGDGTGNQNDDLLGPVFSGPVFAPVGGAGGVGGAAGGSGAGGTTTTAGDGTDFCDAKLVMQSACGECHGASTQFGAPMSLATYEDLMAPAFTRPDLKVYQLVGMRIHDPVRPMPEAPRMLTAEQMATLDAWITAGAPAGADPTCADTSTTTGGTGGEVMATGGTGGTANGEFAWPADCEEFHTFTAYSGAKTNPATIGAGEEAHPQFYFDVPWTGKVQALAFRSITDNSKVLHHWIMYSGQKFVVGWAPGKVDTNLPEDVGMYMPSSGQLRLDVHYNNAGGAAAEQDASGVEVCITRTFRANTAEVMGLMGNASVGAGQSVDNRSSCTASVTGGPVTVMSVSPHMHKLGTHAFLGLNPANTVKEIALHDAPFNFEDQRVYPVSQ